MSYNQVFGGGSINPSQRTFALLEISADVDLQWPIEQQIGGNDVVADIMNVDALVPGLNVDFGDARQVSEGFTSLFKNIGANTVTIRDSAGGTIISLASGEAWFVYLADVSTAAGTWDTFQLGASVSSASAAALAGAGIKAITTTLNQTMPPVLTSTTPVNLTTSDRARAYIWEGGTGTVNLPSAVTVGSDWFVMLRNSGSGDLTVTPPSGVVDDAASIVLSPGESGIFVTDGTDYFSIGRGQQSTSIFDFVQIDVSGTGDFTLSGPQLNRVSYRFTGTLTGNRNIIVPNTIQQYWVDNSTSGAFDLFVKTVAQVTPVEIEQGTRKILYCDGTNVVGADSGTVTLPLTIPQGGTGQTTAGAALSALGGVPTARLVSAGTGISGGGDLSADRTISLDTSNSRNVDHSAVSILAGDGLNGGGNLLASRTLNVDSGNGITVPGGITGGVDFDYASMTTIGGLSVDPASDAICVYDASANLHKRMLMNQIGNWLRTAGFELSGTFVPTFSGFSSAPSLPTVRYYIVGKMAVIKLDFSVGTSNATTFTITNVPAALQPAGEDQVLFLGSAVDNGANIDGCTIRVQQGSAVWAFGAGHANPGGGGWTAANAKGLGNSEMTFTYCLDFTP